MRRQLKPGLGELLRHLTELVDQGAGEIYQRQDLAYRPRYTPIMRFLAGGVGTIGDITSVVQITQGAVSQTVKLMEADGLVLSRPGSDGRQSKVSLTEKGTKLLGLLDVHWATTFRAIEELEVELGFPLRLMLADAIEALQRKGFADRLNELGDGQLQSKIAELKDES